MSDIFTVIADPTRREILSVLLDRRADTGEASVSEIVDALGVPQPTVSKHLKTLRDAGLVEVREDGQHRLYRLEPGPLDVVDDWLMPFVFEGEEHTDGGLGAAAFAAWAGANVGWKQTAEQARAAAERALDRANEVVQHPAPFGTSLGRRAAEAAHEARARALDVQERLAGGRDRASHAIDDARGRLRKRDDVEGQLDEQQLDEQHIDEQQADVPEQADVQQQTEEHQQADAPQQDEPTDEG